MAKQTINIGTAPNTGTGDALRIAFTKANQNFTELYERPVFSGAYADLTGKPALFDGDYNSLSNKPSLFSGNYVDLSNKPSIPVDISDLTDTQGLLAIVGSSDSLVNGEFTLSLSNSGVLTLPQGSLIGETLVTDNPTVVIQPANPEHESQLLFIKGGVPGFSNTENGITISVSALSYQADDIVSVSVFSGLPEGTTLYWWVDQYSPGQDFSPDNGVIQIGQFGDAFFDFTVLNAAIPFRVYVAETLYDAFATNNWSVSPEMNAGAVDNSLHLHLTTGDLTQTSIFLGTDNHNVRTNANGSIELTSYDYGNDQTYRLNFKNNTLRISSTDNPNEEDLYIKAEDDLYLDALGDDIHIRASDDIRIRPGYDFDNDEYAWQYRFIESSGGMTISDYNNQYGGIYPIQDEQDGERGISLESEGSTYIKSEYGNYTWKFGRDGDLILPTGGSILDSNGNSVLSESTNTGNITFNGNEIQGNLLGTVGTIITVNQNHIGNTSQNSNVFALTKSEDTNQVDVGWVIRGSGGGAQTIVNKIDDGSYWSFYVPSGTQTEFPITIESSDYVVGSDARLVLTVNPKSWTFSESGEITFPDSSVQTTAYVPADTVSKITGTWVVTPGTANYNFTVPANGVYQLWVRCNIPNGIISYIATAHVTNSNVPVLGTQHAWNYIDGGSPILITSLPTQFIGTQGQISTASPSVGAANTFVFGIQNNTSESVAVEYGYAKIS